MDYLAQMICGQIHINEYIVRLNNSELLQNQLRMLVPEEARYNRECTLWSSISYDAFESCNFDLLCLLNRLFEFDGSIADNLNIHTTISKVYVYCNPSVLPTTVYHDSFNLLLDTAGERYGGPEVDRLIDVVIQGVLNKYTTKKGRRHHAKEQLKFLFHVENNKLPCWIHGPEWPMGIKSPMKYISSRKWKKSDGKEYIFQDVDSGEYRTVLEMY